MEILLTAILEEVKAVRALLEKQEAREAAKDSALVEAARKAAIRTSPLNAYNFPDQDGTIRMTE